MRSHARVRTIIRRVRTACLLVVLLTSRAARAELAIKPVEPSYNGRPLSYWVLGDARSFDSIAAPDSLTPESQAAVREIGADAVPILLRWLSSPSPVTASRALRAFSVLGPVARPVIDVL